MKFIFITTASFILLSCINPKKDVTQDNPNDNSLSQKKYQPIDKNHISKIVLLIADTSIIDPQHKELPNLLRIGSGNGFVDSTGTPIFKPTQEIVLQDSSKDNFLDVLNGYLKIPQDTTIATSCFILYRHAFILYDAEGEISELINLCLDCAKLDFFHRDAFIQFLDNERMLFSTLLRNLKLTSAFVPDKM